MWKQSCGYSAHSFSLSLSLWHFVIYHLSVDALKLFEMSSMSAVTCLTLRLGLTLFKLNDLFIYLWGEASRGFCIIYTVILMLLVSHSVFAFVINDSSRLLAASDRAGRPCSKIIRIHNAYICPIRLPNLTEFKYSFSQNFCQLFLIHMWDMTGACIAWK